MSSLFVDKAIKDTTDMTSPNARIARSRKRSSRDVGGSVTEKSTTTVSRKKSRTIKKKVSWTSAKPSIRVQLDSRWLFPNYDEGDVWYMVSPDFDDLLRARK